MTTTPTKAPKYHVEVVALLLDILAAYTDPAFTGALSAKATSAARQYAKRAGLPESDVLPSHYTGNGSNYYEVSARDVAAILSARLDVVNLGTHAWRGRQKQTQWATKSNVERWAADREAFLRARVEADTRVRVLDRSTWDDPQFVVLVDNHVAANYHLTTRVGGHAGTVVTLITVDQGRAAAEALATTLRRSLVEVAS